MGFEDEIRRFIFDNFMFGQANEELKNDESLLGAGVIDSTGVLELVAHLEQQYQISVEDDELLPENLDSVDNLTAYIARKRAGTGA